MRCGTATVSGSAVPVGGWLAAANDDLHASPTAGDRLRAAERTGQPRPHGAHDAARIAGGRAELNGDVICP